MQRRQGRVAVGEQHRLGDFEFEPVRRETRRRERANDGAHQIGVLELHGRKIDGDADVLRPAHVLLARLTQDPLAYRHDQSGLFRQRNEIEWRHETSGWIIPAQQSLES